MMQIKQIELIGKPRTAKKQKDSLFCNEMLNYDVRKTKPVKRKKRKKLKLEFLLD